MNAPANLRDTDFRLAWIEREVAILERKIEFFDDLSFKIKGWAITVWSALISFALTRNDWRIAAIGSLVPLLFLVVDASYKRYQVAFVNRTREIMRLLNDPEFPIRQAPAFPFAVYDLLSLYGERRSDRAWGSVGRMVTRASVGLVYWVLLAIGAAVVALQSLQP